MEKYLKPEMDIVEFEAEDVITTSYTTDCQSNCPKFNQPIELPPMPIM